MGDVDVDVAWSALNSQVSASVFPAPASLRSFPQMVLRAPMHRLPVMVVFKLFPARSAL